MSALSYNDSITSWKTESDEPCSEPTPIRRIHDHVVYFESSEVSLLLLYCSCTPIPQAVRPSGTGVSPMSTPVEELRSQLTEAVEGTVDNETRDHIETALALVDKLSGPELLECPVCGRMGLPERIVNHNRQRREVNISKYIGAIGIPNKSVYNNWIWTLTTVSTGVSTNW